MLLIVLTVVFLLYLSWNGISVGPRERSVKRRAGIHVARVAGASWMHDQQRSRRTKITPSPVSNVQPSQNHVVICNGDCTKEEDVAHIKLYLCLIPAVASLLYATHCSPRNGIFSMCTKRLNNRKVEFVNLDLT